MAIRPLKRSWLLCFVVLFFGSHVGAQLQDTSFQCNLAEQMPEFPGGMKALTKYLLKLKYPQNDSAEAICGRIAVRFVINKSGRTEQIKIMKGCNDALMETAVAELIQNMPAWIPGRHNGKIVDCSYILPVTVYWKE